MDHLKANSSGENIDVIMLSDDRGNREKAKATGIKSCGGKDLQEEGCFDGASNTDSLVIEYVESIKDTPELLDMVSAPKAAAGEQVVYEEVQYTAIPLQEIMLIRPCCSTCHPLRSKTASKREHSFKHLSMSVCTMFKKPP